MSLFGLALLATTPDAAACGGFFCQTIPVDQSAERIVFAVNDTAQTVEMHVQVSYAGAAPEFAWIVPVSGVPELFISSDALFTEIAGRTQPQFNLNWTDDGTCTYPMFGGTKVSADAVLDEAEPPSDNGVTVVGEQRLGPYETVTLHADSSAQLLDWLQANQYQLPDDLDVALAPYVASEQYFVALRLANDTDLGDLQPLGLRYSGTKPAIPIRLTSVAATPDMRLEVYVFGNHRFVPENYLHVRINEALISWTDGGQNYPDVITVAANDAGGQAFATDYAGSTNFLRGTIAQTVPDLDGLREIDDPASWVEALFARGGLRGSTALLAYLQEAIPMPPQAIADGIAPSDFYNELAFGSRAWSGQMPAIDGDAVTDGLITAVLAPLEAAQAMVDAWPYLARMTSSISPLEMTVDPSFVANPEMGDVAQVHEAELLVQCNGRLYDRSPRVIVLSDGREIVLPSFAEMEALGQSDAEFLAESDLGAAAEQIERTGPTGAPSLVQDNLPGILSALDAHNAAMRGGCNGGCDAGGGGVWIAVIGASLMVRRRR